MHIWQRFLHMPYVENFRFHHICHVETNMRSGRVSKICYIFASTFSRHKRKRFNLFFVVINNCTSKYSPIYRYEKRHYIFSFLSFCIFTLSKCTFAKMWPICGFRIERSATVVVVSLLTSTKVPCHSCWSNLYEFLCLICLVIWQYDSLLSDDNFLIDSHIYFKQLQF